MAINPPRIAGQPVTHIGATAGVRPIPPWWGVNTESPEREGQIYYLAQSVGSAGLVAYLYVAVNDQGVLKWAPVSTATFYDAYTGILWDPLADH